MSRFKQKAMFSEVDHLIVRTAVSQLSSKECAAITLRFWENFSIQEVAKALRVDWNNADALIDKALKKLWTLCLSYPQFSGNRLRIAPAMFSDFKNAA